jgi:hypothetical protein
LTGRGVLWSRDGPFRSPCDHVTGARQP